MKQKCRVQWFREEYVSLRWPESHTKSHVSSTWIMYTESHLPKNISERKIWGWDVMMRNIRIEVQKILHLPYLLLGVAGIIALCLTATGDMNVGGSQISIFSLLIRPEVTGWPYLHRCFWHWDIWSHCPGKGRMVKSDLRWWDPENCDIVFPRFAVERWLEELFSWSVMRCSGCLWWFVFHR